MRSLPSPARMFRALAAAGLATPLVAAAQAAASAAGADGPTDAAAIRQLQDDVADLRAQLARAAARGDNVEGALESQGLKQLKFSGWMEPVWLWTSGQRRAGFQFVDSGADGEYAIDNGAFGMAMLDIQKDYESGAKWHLGLAPNRGGEGIAIDGHSIVHEASISVPLGDLQTRFIAGQIPDWSGHEPLLGTQNKLVTHNLLFDFTLPAGYTGAGVELVRDAWDVKLLLANVNASRRHADERLPALAMRVDYYKGEFSGVGGAAVVGRLANFRADDPAGNPVTGSPYDTHDTMAHLFEVDGYYVRGDWTLTGQASVGGQRRAAITADPVTGDLRDSRWWGLSALAAWKLQPRLELVARADHFHDRANGGGAFGWCFADGRSGLGPDPSGDPGIGTNRQAVSLGVRFASDESLAWKLEARLDHADKAVFQDVASGHYRHDNQILAASVVMSF